MTTKKPTPKTTKKTEAKKVISKKHDAPTNKKQEAPKTPTATDKEKEVKKLLKELEESKIARDKKRIRKNLRQLGWSGGLRKPKKAPTPKTKKAVTKKSTKQNK